MGCAVAERPGSSEPGRPMLEALLPEDGNVILCPSRVGHASALLLAFGGRRAPEPDLVEILETIGGAPGVGQKLVAFASCGHRRHGPEPGGKVTLQLGVQRMLEPLIGAVGVLGLGMHPAVAASLGFDGAPKGNVRLVAAE